MRVTVRPGLLGLRLSTDAALQRSKAFTLFLSAYEEARHAVSYLRRHGGDASAIAPSLYAGRGGRRPAADGAEEAAQGEAPAAGDVGSVVEANAAEASPAAKGEAPPPQIQINNPKNLPIDNPFITN